MFHSARLKLTVWYVLTIMFVSLIFSAVLYKILATELNRFARLQRVRIERQFEEQMFFPSSPAQRLPPFPVVDPQLLDEAQKRLLYILIIINVTLFFAAAGLAYVLAGKTLEPIQEMVEEQKQFIADASHELRTPLTALRSSIEVSLRDKKLTLTQAKELLASNLDEVGHLQTLSDALLKLTEHEKTNGIYIFKNLALTEVVQDAIKKVKPLMQKKQITLVEQLEPIAIEADSKSLNELFVILLDNAIKYSSAHTTVTVRVRHRDGKAVITVSDQGIGIDTESLPHIFDRFYRADKSRSKEQTAAGYGLGLSIAKKIVTVHNGSIEVTSKIGKGTAFSVTLPLKQAVAQY